MVRYTLGNIKHTKLRSWLTMVGIFIGILAIVVLIGLADGLKADISSELEGFGANTIIITPSSQGLDLASSQTAAFQATSGKLFDKDYDKIKNIPGIEYISRIILGNANVVHKDEDVQMSVFGVEASVFKQTVGSFDIDRGRFLEEGERGVAVIGSAIATEAFERDLTINSRITIAGKSYKVIGILEETGNSFFNADNLVFIDFDDSREIFEDVLAKNEISSIRLTIEEGQDISDMSDRVETILLLAHKVNEDEKDFSLVTAEQINENVENVTGALSLFLAAVAGISLIVGGIGISNTMFMNVIERTKEIGVLKALGATKDEVVMLFIIESGTLGITGGVAGIVVGVMLLSLLSAVAGISTIVSIEVVVLALLFSAIIGVVSGAIPARRASEVSPVEALRYE